MPAIMVGSHEVWVAEESMVVRYHGVVTIEHVRALFALSEKVKQQYGDFLMLADLSDTGAMGPEARRYVSENVKESAFPIFMIGINPVSRLLISLMMRAIGLLGRQPPKIRFLANEREAREEMAVARDKLRVQRAAR